MPTETLTIVTGASGFIGRAVTDELRRRRVPVCGVSRQALTGNRGLQALQVKTYDSLSFPPGAKLIHLAEEAEIERADKHGASYVRQTTNRVTSLLRNNPSRFVYLSSDRASSAIGAYAEAKRAAEQLVAEANGVSLRLATVYGPGMRQATLVADILKQVPGSGPVRLKDAAAMLNLLWIEDAARGICDALEGHQVGIFDLCSDHWVSAGDVANYALKLSGETDRDILSDTTSAEVRMPPEKLTAMTTFGWVPMVSLEEGLAKLMGVPC